MSETGELPLSSDYAYSYSSERIDGRLLKDSIRRIRSEIAPFRFQLAARQISKELEFQGGEKVLEIGSGLGLLGKAIKDEVAGDIDYLGIELAFRPAEKSKKATIVPTQADAVRSPFPNDSFDVVVSTDVLEHVPDAAGAVREINRVLKPGGKAFIVIADPSEGRFRKVEDHIDRAQTGSDIEFWENVFEGNGLNVLRDESRKHRRKDWRKIFNLPILVKMKDRPGFACAFNPVNRPGTYVLEKRQVDESSG